MLALARDVASKPLRSGSHFSLKRDHDASISVTHRSSKPKHVIQNTLEVSSSTLMCVFECSTEKGSHMNIFDRTREEEL